MSSGARLLVTFSEVYSLAGCDLKGLNTTDDVLEMSKRLGNLSEVSFEQFLAKTGVEAFGVANEEACAAMRIIARLGLGPVRLVVLILSVVAIRSTITRKISFIHYCGALILGFLAVTLSTIIFAAVFGIVVEVWRWLAGL
jgi:hypothetical protein